MTNTIDGYTVLNVHPWTMEGKDLDYLVSKLAPHIELVYVRDMLDAIRENVLPPFWMRKSWDDNSSPHIF